MPPKYPKKDDNQPDIERGLRELGISFADTSALGRGFPDLVIGYRRRNFLIEIKDGAKVPSARRLTPAEEEFRDGWGGQYSVCKNLKEVLDIIGFETKGGT